MKKIVKRIAVCFLAAVCFWCGGLLADRQRLDEELIRFHVVAASDSAQDQKIKLQVRDALTASLKDAMHGAADTAAAEAYIHENLDKLQQAANETLEMLGCEDSAVVTYCREKFDARKGELVSLPAGIYNALRVTIGRGEGKNWWGVIFPEICGEAVSIGEDLPASVTDTHSGKEGTQIRFYLLDKLGQLEKYLSRD